MKEKLDCVVKEISEKYYQLSHSNQSKEEWAAELRKWLTDLEEVQTELQDERYYETHDIFESQFI